jgi:hypothetical protein
MTISRRVEIGNTSDELQHVELYPGAAEVVDNAFTIFDGRKGNELTSWVTLESTSVDLPPGERKSVKVTITVPPTASKLERYGAIWAQVAGHCRLLSTRTMATHEFLIYCSTPQIPQLLSCLSPSTFLIKLPSSPAQPVNSLRTFQTSPPMAKHPIPHDAIVIGSGTSGSGPSMKSRSAP